jgi:hypothetical protein
MLDAMVDAALKTGVTTVIFMLNTKVGGWAV